MRLRSRVFDSKIELQNELKAEKHDRKPLSTWDILFHRFVIAWGLENGSPEPTDPSQTICFPISERTPAFLTRSGFCIDFGTRLAPFWHHFEVEMGEKNKKIASEPASKNHRFFEWFFDRFFDHFGLHLGLSFCIPGPPNRI